MKYTTPDLKPLGIWPLKVNELELIAPGLFHNMDIIGYVNM
jgi:hypothetical protein